MKHNHIFVLLVLLAMLITGCNTAANHAQQYVEKANIVLEENQLDGEARMEYYKKSHEYDVYNLIITSEKFAEIPNAKKKKILKELADIYVTDSKLLVLEQVSSQGYIFNLYEEDLNRDGQLYPPEPTSTPFVMPMGDFTMRWDSYDSEYNSLGGIITIRRQGEKYTMLLVMPDGSSDTRDMTVISNGSEVRLTDRPGNAFGDYMYISSTGYLYFCDAGGVIYTVPPLD